MFAQLCAESCAERKPEAVQIAQHAEIAIEIEAALEIEHRGDLAGLVDPLDVRRVLREFDLVPILIELRAAPGRSAQRLLGLEPLRIVILRDEDREEHRVDAALLGARQIELAVRDALADVAAVIKLAIDDVDVRIEDERVLMQLACARRTLQPRGAAESERRRQKVRFTEFSVESPIMRLDAS